jgi:integrase
LAQVRQYVAQRRSAGASDATINRELAIVRRGFRLGAQEDPPKDPPLVKRQPAISMLEKDNVRQGFLEQEQYERLLEELPASLKALFVCGYHTGARKNELWRIRWEQVDSETGLIRLSAGQTKGQKARTLPIRGDMRRWLERPRESCPAGSTRVLHGTYNCPVGNHLNGWRKPANAPAWRGCCSTICDDRYNIVDVADLENAGKRLEDYAKERKQEGAAKLRRVK